jgi:hypothetical protein
MPYAVITLCIAIVSLILAVVGHEIANPLYLIMFAVWLTLFLPAQWPW